MNHILMELVALIMLPPCLVVTVEASNTDISNVEESRIRFKPEEELVGLPGLIPSGVSEEAIPKLRLTELGWNQELEGNTTTTIRLLTNQLLPNEAMARLE